MEASEALVQQKPFPKEPQHKDQPKAVAKSPWFFSPTIDVLFIGGASIVFFAFFWLFVDSSSSINQISWTAFYLAFAINNPHFMASYALLYWDKRHELLKKKSFFWAAVIVPTILIGFYVTCIATGDARLLGYALNVMYFSVGWHYVKQIYGTVVVSSARRGYYFTPKESWALKLNLYPVWFMSFLNGNTAIGQIKEYGIETTSFGLPPIMKDINYGLLVVSLVALAAILFTKYLREGKVPGWTALASFAAIYIWYLPSFYHPHFFYFIPLFHSLQYLLFVWTLKKNQYKAEAAETTKDPIGQRLYFSRNFFGFCVMVTVAALFTFNLIPKFLDSSIAYDRSAFGPELFMFCFITFINIHHYFIDNVIWRRDNPALKMYL